MSDGSRWGLIAGAAAMFALAPAACGHQGQGSGAAREPSAEVLRPDAGLPPPPPASRKGVTVPSDLGFGAGPAGPSTNGGTPPATPPPTMPNGT